MGTPSGGLDSAWLRAIAASDRPLAPHECAQRARLAAALIEPGLLDRSGPGEVVLLWRDEHSEAWLNLWWQPRDTGYHDHAGSCVGVHVIDGRAWNEPLTIGAPPQAREYGPGETFWSPGEASTAWITRPGPSPSTCTRHRSGRSATTTCTTASCTVPKSRPTSHPHQRRALRGAPPARWR